MKRNISFIIVLSIILSLFSFSIVSAVEPVSPTVELTYTNLDNMCTVTAKLKGITTPLVGIELILNYDATVLSYESQTNNLNESTINQILPTIVDSKLNIVWNAKSEATLITPNAVGEILLCTISFNILKTATTAVSVNSESLVAIIEQGKELPNFVHIATSQKNISVTYTAPVTNPPAGGGGGGGSAPVTPIPTPTPENTFIDLGGYDWASSSIYKLSKLGIIKGTSENTFSPANNITRADFAVLLSRTFNLKGEVTGNFDDVPAGEYFYQPIGILKSLDIAKGSEGKYRPYDSITRQDIIVLTHRALTLLGNIKDSPDYDILNKFEDKGSISNYATESVCIMISRGIIKGNDGQLAPLNNATRAEAAVIFDRIYNHGYALD